MATDLQLAIFVEDFNRPRVPTPTRVKKSYLFLRVPLSGLGSMSLATGAFSGSYLDMGPALVLGWLVGADFFLLHEKSVHTLRLGRLVIPYLVALAAYTLSLAQNSGNQLFCSAAIIQGSRHSFCCLAATLFEVCNYSWKAKTVARMPLNTQSEY